MQIERTLRRAVGHANVTRTFHDVALEKHVKHRTHVLHVHRHLPLATKSIDSASEPIALAIYVGIDFRMRLQMSHCRGARRHGHGISRERTTREDAAPPGQSGEHFHQIRAAGDGADRHTAAQYLAVGGEIWRDAEVTLSACIVDAKAGNDFVEHQRHGAGATHFLQLTEKVRDAGLRIGTLHAFDHDQCEFIFVFTNRSERRSVAVGQHAYQGLNGFRNAASHRQCVQIVRSARGIGEHHAVVVGTVIGAIEQCNGFAPGKGTRGTNGVEGGLGASVAEHHAFRAGARLLQQLGKRHLCGAVDAKHPTLVRARHDRVMHDRMTMTKHVQAKTYRGIDVAIAIGIDHP